jgi:hypothetical protein
MAEERKIMIIANQLNGTGQENRYNNHILHVQEVR